MKTPNQKDLLRLSTLGAFLCFLSVALGAFGAHGLKNHVTEYELEVFKTGVFYQFIHAVVILFLPALKANFLINIQRVGYLFVGGTILFSGSLYMLVISKIKILGAITPFGGICFLTAWVILALELLAASKKATL